jgi:hypothetical protein
VVRAGHFTWSNYQSLLEKAKRDPDLLSSRPEHPEDVIFNLVVTIDHIFDWAKADSSLDAKTHQAALALRKSDSAVAVINQLSVGAKHLVLTRTPPVKTSSTSMGWGTMPWGSGPWGGGVIYEVEIDGSMRDITSVATDALNAWRALLP